jgi:hypothetical protein
VGICRAVIKQYIYIYIERERERERETACFHPSYLSLRLSQRDYLTVVNIKSVYQLCIMCRPSYEYHSDITFTHSSFCHASHPKEGQRVLLFPLVCLRLVVNSNTPLPPSHPPNVSAVNPSLLLHILVLTSQLFTGFKPQSPASLKAFIIGKETMSKVYVTVGV